MGMIETSPGAGTARPHPMRDRPVIDAVALGKRYGETGREQGAGLALDHVALAVDQREFVAISGPSGSGKSTLLNLLGCLDRPTAGRYRLDGLDVTRLPDDALSDIRNRKIGFVFQQANLLPRASVVENVELPLIYRGVPPRERRRAAEAKLELVGLSDRRTHRPNQLSGGEQQRAAIARALVQEPKVILADEPTAALDEYNSNAVMALLGTLNRRGRTIVMVTHDTDLALRFVSRMVTLFNGRLRSDRSLNSRGQRSNPGPSGQGPPRISISG